MRVSKQCVIVLVAATVATLSSAPVRTQVPPAPDAREAAAPTGRLRVGLYPGSPTSMVRDRASGETKGLAFDLGREFARRLNVPFEPVEFPQIANVLEALKQGQVDFTVTNASPARAQYVDFTSPILGVELGYLVPAGSPIATQADVDRPGVRVGVTAGGSSHTTLSREFKFAAVVPAQTLAIAMEMFSAGKVDAYATNKAVLFEMSSQSPGSRVLEGRWGIERFAIAIPKGRDQALAAASRFADDAKSTGLVTRAADRAGLRGIVGAK
jgi:polar amino acid transport system substrate-binding protein